MGKDFPCPWCRQGWEQPDAGLPFYYQFLHGKLREAVFSAAVYGDVLLI